MTGCYNFSLVCLLTISFILPFYECLEANQLCEDGSSWIENDCSNCTCKSGQKSCLPIECNSNSSVTVIEDSSERTCEFTSEGARWRKNCNWCRCHATDGTRLCSRRGCPPELSIHLREAKQCEVDAKWKKDPCNWCQCVDEQPVCSDNPCSKIYASDRKSSRRKLTLNSRGSRRFRKAEECQVKSEGSRWRRSCNWCRCSPQNLKGICTRKRCHPDHESLGKKEPTCEGDAMWKKENCNWCHCVNGTGVCTLMHCFSSQKSEAQVLLKAKPSEEPTTVVCESDLLIPGRWRKGCNWCRCDNGKAACTKKGCLASANGYKKDTDICQGSVRWKKDCNWCECKDNKATCSKIDCEETTSDSSSVGAVIIVEKPCVNGASWVDNCSTCYCIGEEVMCTNQDCTINSHTEFLAHQNAFELQKLVDQVSNVNFKYCKDNSRWREQCNWCNCNNDKPSCTVMGCIGDWRNVEPQCEDKSIWKQDCDICVCQKGVAICKKSECTRPNVRSEMVKETKSMKTPSTCTEGSQWMKKCNWCSCNEGNSVCTLRACLSETIAMELDATCKGDSKWKVKCNWCHCASGKGICTQKFCLNENNVNIAPSLPASGDAPSEEKTCTNGSSWTELCNTCTCYDNIALCTKKNCEVPRSDQCSEKQMWKEDCNTCQCINGISACTRRICRSLHALPELCYKDAIMPNAASCEAYFPKWTYKTDKGSCLQIIYGGCNGTENLFDTEEECRSVCGGRQIARMGDEPSKEHCNLPLQLGSCSATFTRYAFMPQRNRCEKFSYSGCGGNQNNFPTAEECLNTCGGEPPVEDPQCDRSKCNWKRFAHYFVKKCTPIYQGGSCCPIKFQCDKEMPESSVKCFYKDIEYDAGDKIPVEDSCSRGCICRPGFNNKPAKIECANVECPSLFNAPEPNCRLIYSEDSCCSVSKECSDPDSPANLELRSSDCKWNGKTFLLGDKMYFDEFPCQTCICTPGFDGPKGLGCRKIDCGLEFRYREQIARGCSPLYFEDSCCPIDWVCPGAKYLSPPVSDALDQEVSSSRSAFCKIGNKTVTVGSSVYLNDCTKKCSCITPPDITCVSYRSCELAEGSGAPPKSEAKCAFRETPCPSNCTVEMEPSSRCPTCICSSTEFQCSTPTCPSTCINATIAFDESKGCPSCQCQERPHCPKNCVVRIIKDPKNGFDICECDPSDSFNTSSP